MSWSYLQEQGAESSGGCSVAVNALGLLKSNHIHGKSCCNGNGTDCSPTSQFGMTSEPSEATTTTPCPTSAYLEAYRTDCASVVAFLVKIFRQQVKLQGLRQIHEVDYGSKWRESLTKYDPQECEWKTHQCLLLGGLESFSETWPKWGIMRNGECWGLTMSAHLIDESESGLWRTPDTGAGGTSNLLKQGKKHRENGQKIQVRLADQVASKHLWPTPTCQEIEHPNAEITKTGRRKSKTSNSSHSLNLADTVRNWPTPTTQDNVQIRGEAGAEGHPNRSTTLGGAVSKKMYPPMVDDGKVSGKNQKRFKSLASTVWATPTCDDSKNNGAKSQFERKSQGKDRTLQLNVQVVNEEGLLPGEGRLNPDWVEWLMGWPCGWTSLEPLTELKFREWDEDPADTGEIPRTIPKKNGTNRVARLKAIGNGQVPACVYAMELILKGKQ